MIPVNVNELLANPRGSGYTCAARQAANDIARYLGESVKGESPLSLSWTLSRPIFSTFLHSADFVPAQYCCHWSATNCRWQRTKQHAADCPHTRSVRSVIRHWLTPAKRSDLLERAFLAYACWVLLVGKPENIFNQNNYLFLVLLRVQK